MPRRLLRDFSSALVLAMALTAGVHGQAMVDQQGREHFRGTPETARPVDPKEEPLFSEINGAAAGGGVRLVIRPDSDEIAILASPLSGFSGAVHYLVVDGNRITLGDGNYSLMLGARHRDDGWTSSGGVALSGQAGYGLISSGAVKIYGAGTVAVDSNFVYRGVESNLLEGALGAEVGLAGVGKPAMVAVSLFSDVAGATVHNEDDFTELRAGTRLRAALAGSMYLRLDLEKMFKSSRTDPVTRAGELVLDLKVCRICVVGMDFKVRQSDVRSDEMVIGIHGGMGM